MNERKISMTPSAMEQKTAVFALGDLRSEPVFAGHQVDDDTRELPLIAGRFAGRQWIVEDLQREAEEKPVRAARPRRRSALALAAGALMALALLLGSLLGQVRLTALNDQAVAVGAEIRVLRQEQDALRVEYAETLSLTAAEEYAVKTLGMQRPYGEQVIYVETQTQDRATVLGVRRGQGMTYLWNSFVDTLGECFH